MIKEFCRLLKKKGFYANMETRGQTSKQVCPSGCGKQKIDHPELMFQQYIASVICKAHPPLPHEVCCIVQGRKQWKNLLADRIVVGCVSESLRKPMVTLTKSAVTSASCVCDPGSHTALIIKLPVSS